jgi:asparagine synthase (glutamine-hydrolysing)
MYALAIWDERTCELILARDTFGIKPLYYSLCGGRVVFASEIKAITPLQEGAPVLNMKAMIDLMDYGYAWGYETIYANIRQVEPGTITRFSVRDGGLDEKTRPITTLRQCISQATRKVPSDGCLEALKTSVSDHMTADVPVSLSLSGGLDSSAVCALAYQNYRNLGTYTVSWPSDTSESRYADIVNRHLRIGSRQIDVRLDRLEHYFEVATTYLEEPIPNIQMLTTTILGERLHEDGLKVVLLGEGADEVFGGYTWHRMARSFVLRKRPGDILSALRRARLNQTSNIVNDSISAMRDSRSREREELFREKLDEIEGTTLQKFLYFDMSFQLVNSQLLRVDKCLMGNSIEGRVPFLYPSVVRNVWNIRDGDRISLWDRFSRDHKGKRALRRCMSRRLPRAVAYREKFGKKGTANLYRMGFGGMFRDDIKRRIRSRELKDALYFVAWDSALEKASPKQLLFLRMLCQLVEEHVLRRSQQSDLVAVQRNPSRSPDESAVLCTPF